MDKYEYKLKTEQMLKLMENGAYNRAAEIADSIDWKRGCVMHGIQIMRRRQNENTGSGSWMHFSDAEERQEHIFSMHWSRSGNVRRVF